MVGFVPQYTGDIAEVIYFNRSLSAQEQVRVQTYLAIKYGIPINPNTQPNFVASDGSTIIWNGLSNLGYSNTVLGIGFDATSGLNQKQSASSLDTDILTIGLGSINTSNNLNSSSFSLDKSFLIVGNNGSATSSVTTAGLPLTTSISTPPMRMALGRVWKAQNTNGVGSVALQFNLTGALSSVTGVPYQISELCLLIDNGAGSFTNSTIANSGITTSATLVSGTSNTYQFSNITLANGYLFTVGLLKKLQTLAFAQNSYSMSVGQTSTITVTNSAVIGSATVTYNIVSGGGSATVDNTGLVTAISFGSVTLTATALANSDYAGASTSTLIIIGPGVQVVTINNIPTGGFSTTVDQTLSITATNNIASGGGTITYSVATASGSGSATINSVTGQLTATGAGAITFTATAAANSNYNQASTSTLIVIGKSTPTLSISVSTTVAVGGTLQAITSTSALYSSGGAVSFTISSSGSGSATLNPLTGLLTATGAGTITLTATSAGDTNYYGATTSTVITINQGTPTLLLTSTSTNVAVNGSATVTAINTLPGAATIADTGGVSYSILSTSGGGSATINANTGAMVAINSGSVTIEALQGSDTNYYAVSATLVINIGVTVQTLSFSSASYTLLTNQTQTITATNSVSNGGAITYSITAGSGSATVNVNTGQVLAIGTGTVTLTAFAAANVNYTASSSTVLITINPSTPILSLSPTLGSQ